MRTLRNINTSAAIIVLLCFFLPWEQVSCGTAHDTLSGLELARNDHILLWFVPILMAALVLSNLIRLRGEQNRALSVAGTICGVITLYLLNRERARVQDEAGVISAQLTGWFWLAFICTFAIIGSGVCLLLISRHAPSEPTARDLPERPGL